MFIEIILIAMASLYLWVLASQLTTPVIAPIQRWLRRGWRRSLVSCPWCAGFWLSLIFTLAVHWGRYDWVVTPLTVLASAAVVGLAGSFTGGILDEDEDEV